MPATKPIEQNMANDNILLALGLKTTNFQQGLNQASTAASTAAGQIAKKFEFKDFNAAFGFMTRVARLRSEREQLFRRLDLDHLTIQTDRPYVRPIAELFRLRQRRERHG